MQSTLIYRALIFDRHLRVCNRLKLSIPSETSGAFDFLTSPLDIVTCWPQETTFDILYCWSPSAFIQRLLAPTWRASLQEKMHNLVLALSPLPVSTARLKFECSLCLQTFAALRFRALLSEHAQHYVDFPGHPGKKPAGEGRARP